MNLQQFKSVVYFQLVDLSVSLDWKLLYFYFLYEWICNIYLESLDLSVSLDWKLLESSFRRSLYISIFFVNEFLDQYRWIESVLTLKFAAAVLLQPFESFPDRV